MIDLAATIEAMKATGMTSDEIVRALACIQAVEAPVRVRTAGAIRQERYRNRHKASQSITSDGSDAGPLLSPKESPQTPKETPPILPSTHKETPLRGSKKGSRLPSDFVPDIDVAVTIGLSRAEAEHQAAVFVDFWNAKAGADAVKVDWPATWRNWARRSARDGPRQRQGSLPTKINPAVQTIDALLENFDAVTPSEAQGNPPYPYLVAASGNR